MRNILWTIRIAKMLLSTRLSFSRVLSNVALIDCKPLIDSFIIVIICLCLNFLLPIIFYFEPNRACLYSIVIVIRSNLAFQIHEIRSLLVTHFHRKVSGMVTKLCGSFPIEFFVRKWKPLHISVEVSLDGWKLFRVSRFWFCTACMPQWKLFHTVCDLKLYTTEITVSNSWAI